MGLLASGNKQRGFSRVIGLNLLLKLSAIITACRGMLSFPAGILILLERGVVSILVSSNT